METFAAVIKKWPTAAELRRDLRGLGVKVQAVTTRSWRRKGIPGSYWHHVCLAARRRGYTEVTPDLLCRLGRMPARPPQSFSGCCHDRQGLTAAVADQGE